MRTLARAAERHQVVLFLLALVVGAVVGFAAPGVGGSLEGVITPVLALLLYLTFLAVPFGALGAAVRDVRFLTAVVVANFVVVPVIVFGLSRFVAADEALLLGVLLVLLTPCVDYVIVFAGLAGGARARLLAATPLLMLLQLVLLPGYLWLMAGEAVAAAVDPLPFVEAFVVLIAIPLALAAVTQAAARRWRIVRSVASALSGAMVPVMMLALAVVVASQIAAVGGAVAALARAIPIFVGFVVLAAVVGAVVGGAARLDVAGRRAAVFSAVTRNSLVVLPLALALPPSLALVPLVVVTQTLVELVAMVILVAVVPRVIRAPSRPPG